MHSLEKVDERRRREKLSLSQLLSKSAQTFACRSLFLNMKLDKGVCLGRQMWVYHDPGTQQRILALPLG